MMRRLLFMTPLLLLGCSKGERPGTPPKHLLLITVDTLRADHLSSWLYSRPTSAMPSTEDERKLGANLSIDDLASQGVMFQNAFAPRGMTSPSVASFLTGLSPLEHGLLDNGQVLDEGIGTLAETFGAAGFDTAGFTGNALLQPLSGLGQGFETFEMFNGPDRDLEVLIGAQRWLADRDLDNGPPVFLWLHFMGPHLPYDPLPLGNTDFAKRFADPSYDGPALEGRDFLERAYKDNLPVGGLDVTYVVSQYDAEIARVNQLVRTFLQLYSGCFEQPAKNRLDDTLLVFAADHGEELYEHNRYWAHSKSVYSSVLHVPLILRHPGSLTGRRVITEKVTLEDVAPTLYEWFDLTPPQALYGRSLLPLVDTYADFEFESRSAYGMWRDQIFTVRASKLEGVGDWRLVWNPNDIEPNDKPPGPFPIPRLALFDLHQDPTEQRNVADEHPEVVKRLSDELGIWLSDRQRVGTSEVSSAVQDAMGKLGYGHTPQPVEK